MSKLNWGLKACVIILFWATAAVGVPAQTFTTLYSFCSQPNCTDGSGPYAGLVQSTNGKFYGTTSAGGANGAGTVFEITPSGTLTTVHSFDGADGNNPRAAPIQATNGSLYGTTQEGGGTDNGTVFKIAPSGALTTLHIFDGADGGFPKAGLVQGINGSLYGTTWAGGANVSYGTVFRITPTGALTTLHNFDNTDGANPEAGLVQAANGNFYGTTSAGGAYSDGTIFKLSPSGRLTTLYSFCSQINKGVCRDGAIPVGGLIQAADGNFYGTTVYGGANNCRGSGCGTIFKVTPSGTLTTIYSFCSQSKCADGADPSAGLIQGTDGNFYGTTELGGGDVDGWGTVFKITPSGTLTTLHTFDFATDGAFPEAGLVQGTNGEFYGTTTNGSIGIGTVFSLSVGLGPFVETNPASGKVGAPVRILGSNLTGATKVTFHGVAAAFTVVSSSEIKTSVPTGATNGLVKVVTPGGTLSSNVPFRVKP